MRDGEAFETPEELFESIRSDVDINPGKAEVLAAVRARDSRVIAWCRSHAEAAEREAEAHRLHDAERMQARDVSSALAHRYRAMRCEGQAVAWRGLIAVIERADSGRSSGG